MALNRIDVVGGAGELSKHEGGTMRLPAERIKEAVLNPDLEARQFA